MNGEINKYTVMIIDNELGSLIKLNKMLVKMGVNVIPAYIQNAFSLLNKKMPNVLCINVNISVRIGLKLLNFVRERSPGLPVLALNSTCGCLLSRKMMTRLGISDYIYNPYEIDELLSRIQYVLKKEVDIRCIN